MPQAKTSTWIGCLLALVSSATALLVADQAYWLWRGSQGRPATGAEVLTEARRKLGTIMDFVPGEKRQDGGAGEAQQAGVLMPYFGGEGRHDAGNVLSYFEDNQDPKRFEVLVMGGSVAANFGNYFMLHAPKSLYAAAEAQGRELVLLNYSHGAYKQPQQLNKLTYLLSLGYRPEAVIELDGFNEVAVALQNGLELGVHPLYPYDPVWGGLLPKRGADRMAVAEVVGRLLVERDNIGALLTKSGQWGLQHSSLASLAIEKFVDRANWRMNSLKGQLSDLSKRTSDTRRDFERQGPEYVEDLEGMLKLCVDAWFHCSLMMHAVCEQYGIRYVQILQPTLFDIGAKPITAREQKAQPTKSWLIGSRQGFPALRARTEALRAQGIEFVDASMVFADKEEDLYYDPCHFIDTGNKYLTEFLEKDLLKGLFGK